MGMKGNKMGLRNYIIVTQCHLKKRHPAASQRWTRGGIASPRTLFEPTNHISIFSVDGFLGLEGQGLWQNCGDKSFKKWHSSRGWDLQGKWHFPIGPHLNNRKTQKLYTWYECCLVFRQQQRNTGNLSDQLCNSI